MIADLIHHAACHHWPVGDATVVEPEGEGRDVVSTLEVAEVPPKQRDVPTPEARRRLVLARDGHRCTVPGCAERGELFAHHVTWRRHGGVGLIVKIRQSFRILNAF